MSVNQTENFNQTEIVQSEKLKFNASSFLKFNAMNLKSQRPSVTVWT